MRTEGGGRPVAFHAANTITTASAEQTDVTFWTCEPFPIVAWEN